MEVAPSTHFVDLDEPVRLWKNYLIRFYLQARKTTEVEDLTKDVVEVDFEAEDPEVTIDSAGTIMIGEGAIEAFRVIIFIKFSFLS